MGCCESTARRASALPLLSLPTSDHQIKGASGMETEEKVKEVLCETPAASKPVEMKPQEPPPPKIGQAKPPPPAIPTASERPTSVPEASDVRGSSEKAPASSTAVDTTGDGGALRRTETSPVKLRSSRAHSLSADLYTSADRGLGKSPTRILPGGIGGSVRIVHSREAAWAQRFDRGEGSGSRSGAPAKRVSGGTRPAATRVPSMRRTDQSPRRIKRYPNGSSKRMNGGSPKQRQSKGRESLESPLVSLECFIFL